jgi:glycosyltransferase involved in cell wall biosynthesis
MFILNSKAEGLPGVLIEAMAANVPCIATNIPGNNELVIHEQTGLLVEEQSPEKLGEAIVRMLSDEQLAKKLAANAFENVAKNYSWQVEKDLWIKLLKEVNES